MNKRGYFGIGIYHCKTEENLGLLWRTAFNFGADFIYTIGKRYHKQCSDTTKSWRTIPLFNYFDFDDFYDHMPYDCKLVAVEINNNARNLKNYIHPERCVYLLGAEDYGLSEDILNRCHDTIMIDTNQCMNVAITGSIIMYDRNNKSNGIKE